MTPGGSIRHDPSAERFIEFDWSAALVKRDGTTAAIATSTFSIIGPDSALTYDNASILSGATSTTARVKGGTNGKTYTLTNRIVTNESPSQTDERSVFIRIAEQ